MIALLVTALPFVDAFWARDLGALQRELVEDARGGEEHLLFEDLLRLATCAPLGPIAEPSPLRELVRVEEARRGQRGTVWDDLSRREFFNRTPWNPDQRHALRWPDEAERWPSETLLVAEPAWSCAGAKPGAGPLPLLTADLLRSLPPEPAARAAYDRSVLQYRRGSLDGAADLAPALLAPDLRRSASFLRLESGTDSPDGWIALAREWPRPAVLMRAAQRLNQLGKHQELVELTAGAGDLPASLMQRHILFLRALSLHALGRGPEMLEVLVRAFALPGPEQGLEPLRALAIASLAQKPFDAPALRRIASPLNPALEQLARQALVGANFDTAREAARSLSSDPDPRWRAQGLALAGEVSWRAGDVPGTEHAFAQLFEPARKLGSSRDPAVLQLAQALVVGHAQRRVGTDRLTAQLAALKAQVHLKAMPQVEALLVAAREAAVEQGEQPVALGEVNVGLPPAPPPAPAIEIELPEPRSLLAIPAQDGSLRAWFEPGGAR